MRTINYSFSFSITYSSIGFRLFDFYGPVCGHLPFGLTRGRERSKSNHPNHPLPQILSCHPFLSFPYHFRRIHPHIFTTRFPSFDYYTACVATYRNGVPAKYWRVRMAQPGTNTRSQTFRLKTPPVSTTVPIPVPCPRHIPNCRREPPREDGG